MKKILGLAVALMLLSSTAQAQSLKAPVITFGVAASMDWASTYHANVAHHGHEDNVLINGLMDSPKLMITAGAAIDVVGTVAWYRLMKNHRKLANAGMYVAAVFRLGLAYRNMKIQSPR